MFHFAYQETLVPEINSTDDFACPINRWFRMIVRDITLIIMTQGKLGYIERIQS